MKNAMKKIMSLVLVAMILVSALPFAASASAMERDVYKPKFLEGRGWTIMRVWSRDWWLSPARVVRAIINTAEKNRTCGQPPKLLGKQSIEETAEE